MKTHSSWGRFPQSNPAQIVPLDRLSELPNLGELPRQVLAYGLGRSYGDCCLNDGGILLDTLGLDRFLHMDQQSGKLRCEAGVTLDSILRLAVPAGWFLSVSPGTKFVTVGGAVANDVHGKNHHRAGSFGSHVCCLELLRSDGERLLCSPDQNADLFRATIGGLGLTGLILWVELQLKSVPGPCIDSEQIRFRRLQEFFELSAASDQTHEYTVAWLDCVSPGEKLGRGIFLRGNHCAGLANGHSPYPDKQRPPRGDKPRLRFAFDAPEILINHSTARLFNALYFHAPLRDFTRRTISYEKFFYPLDRIAGWNRLYGRRGFLQYQFVVPYEKRQVIEEILRLIEASRLVCTLSVLKVFGTVRSPGMLSFPRPGVTLALDFPIQGQATFNLCERFDEKVRASGGAVYPAKDARMSAASFHSYFPNLGEFSRLRDPHFSSDFWRRVTGSTGGTPGSEPRCALAQMKRTIPSLCFRRQNGGPSLYVPVVGPTA
jgi:FAD/FMN-containing dehydrogenase